MSNLVKVKRGLKASLPALNIGEFGFVTDTNELYIGTASGNVKLFPSEGSGLGYSLQATATSFSPSDALTYYIGMPPKASTTADRYRVYFPKAGTIKRAIVYWCATGTAGTAERIDVYLRKNNSSDTLIGYWNDDQKKKVMNNGELNISVSAGDYFEIKIVCPTWATNPTNVLISAVVYIE